jgi:hypothetical protein
VRFWTDEERAIVRREYPHGGVAAVMALLPYRTSIEIRSWACGHGVVFLPRVVLTPGMEAEMEALFLQGGEPAVKKRFPDLGKTFVYAWARKKGIKRAAKPKKVQTPKSPTAWTMPAQDVLQQLECRRFKRWRYPVKPASLVPTIGRRAA